MLDHIGLGGKIKGGTLTLSAASLVLAAVSITATRSLKTTVDAVVQVDAQKVQLAGRIQYSSAELLRLENGIIFRLMSQDAAGSELYKKKAAAVLADLRKQFDELRPLVGEAGASGTIADMASTVQSWGEIHKELCAKLEAQQYDEAQKIAFDRITPTGERVVTLAGQYVASVSTELQKAQQDAGLRETMALVVMIICAVLALLCAGAVYWIVHGASVRLLRVSEAMGAQAQQVAASAAQVSSSSSTLARSASDQAASLEETSASSEEIDGMTRRTAAHMAQAANRMAETNEAAHKAADALAEMTSAMRGIAESSNKISRIIKVIDEIAFQTNILALNAAVEAARAGEAGSGFAVVAEEVRNLAQRSGDAARETATLIEESITRSEDGNRKVQTVEEAVRSITSISTEVKKLIDEVNVGAQQQAAGVKQVAETIAHMQRTTQEYAAGAQESAAAGVEMSTQSGGMKETAGELLELIVGRGVRRMSG